MLCYVMLWTELTSSSCIPGRCVTTMGNFFILIFLDSDSLRYYVESSNRVPLPLPSIVGVLLH